MFLPDVPRWKRQGASHAPCPEGNGTLIGIDQQFIVFCNTKFKGTKIFHQKADSLATCTTLCTSFQNPRCEGAQYGNNGDCVLVGNLVPDGTRPFRFFDSAVALFPDPGPTSSCSQQGTGTSFLSGASRFNLQCGSSVSGNDIEQQFQMTFEGCMGACGTNPKCGGVSYATSQDAGFKNCYLKSPFAKSELFAMPGIDSAFIADDSGPGVVGAEPVSITDVAPAGPAVTTIITPTISVITESSTTLTVSVPVTTTAGSSTNALADTETPSTTASGDNNADNSGNGRPPKFTSLGASTSSNAWIAAPVIGGVAAFTLILAVFILWGRRRRRDNPRPSTSSRNVEPMPTGSISDFGFGFGNVASRISRGRLFGTERSKLGDSGDETVSRYGNNRGGFKVVSGSGRRLGFGGYPGTGPGMGGIVTGAGGRQVDSFATSRSNSRESRESRPESRAGSSAGLRDSQNGLRQNRLTGNWAEALPGIPPEFSGPEVK
ncbi:hypothetical protein GGR57DRAFT_220326 [Xylariaceae sp. FL1272]|nr:hypothetical protein GGR57DRAFT_220326 [Xylariaceae sp. FL1272]